MGKSHSNRQATRKKRFQYFQRLLSLGQRTVDLWREGGSYTVLRRAIGKVLRTVGLRGKQPYRRRDNYLRRLLPIAVPESLRSSSEPFPNQNLEPWQSERVLERMELHPLISIVVPVYQVSPNWLDLCVDSVVQQHYTNWELLLIDDCSQQTELTQCLRKWADKDERIQRIELDTNQGIAGATNVGLSRVRGSFVGFLDHDDELTPDALTWVVAKHNEYPQAQWFYSDEDKIDVEGNTSDHFHKPDFSLAYLLSCMFTCHFSVYAKSILDRLGGLRLGFDGSQDHDLVLRMSEIVPRENIVHIPRILYHWRLIPSSASTGAEAKPKAAEAGRKAVREALHRRNLDGEVASAPKNPSLYQVRFRPRRTPRVSVLIPTRNSVQDLKACIDALRAKTNYTNYEIVVIDNQSESPELAKYSKEQSAHPDFRTVQYDRAFNHSAMHNTVIDGLASEFVVFLNNDVQIRSEHWLEQLLGTAELDTNIAGVGCRLDFPDQTTQHAGMVLGPLGHVVHAHKHLPADHIGFGFRIIALGEFSACSASMLLMNTDAFRKVKGFNATRFPNSYNDADLWLRLHREGYRCVYNPCVHAIHHEAKSRTRIVDAVELEAHRRFVEDWEHQLNSDPFYNRNLPLDNEQFRGFRSYPVEEDFPFLLDPTT